MFRLNGGRVLAFQILDNGRDTQRIKLRFKRRIAEIIFAAYTINENPYHSGGPGRIYDVTIEAF